MRTDEQNANTCRNCGKKKTSSTQTLTGWIFACGCEETTALDHGKTKRLLCGNCYKPLNQSKKPSFTQWVLHPASCSCEHPFVSDEENDAARAEKTLSEFQTSPGSSDSADESAPVEPASSVEFHDRYHLIETLASGKHVVQICRDSQLNRTVVVKLLSTTFITPDDVIAFQSEAKAMCKLKHDNIVRILDFGVARNVQPYMVLEYVPGNSLRQHLDLYGPFKFEEACRLMYEVADALLHAHEMRIYHRDLKPENMMLWKNKTGQLTLKVIDFGLVKSANTDDTIFGDKSLVGSPAYMAPDQARGIGYGKKSEIYSFGCVFFEMLVGHRPFDAETPTEMLSQHAQAQRPCISALLPDTPQADSKLDAFFLTCLAINPNDRFKDFGALKLALEDLELPNLISAAPGKRSLFSIKRLLADAAVVPVVAIVLASSLGVFSEKSQSPVKAVPRNQENADMLDLASVDGRTFETPLVRIEEGAGTIRLTGPVDEDDYVRAVKAFPSARTIYCTDVNTKGFEKLSTLPLKHAYLWRTHADPVVIDTLASIPTLKFLLLRKSAIDQSTLAKLSSFSRLNCLIFDCTYIADKDLKYIKKVKHLETLVFREEHGLTSVGIASLANVSTLRHLALQEQKLAAQDFDALGKLHQLNKLLVNETEMTDPMLARLAHLNIRELDVSANPLSRNAFDSLAKMKNLQLITISPNANLTIRDITMGKKKLSPNCKVQVKYVDWKNNAIDEIFTRK